MSYMICQKCGGEFGVVGQQIIKCNCPPAPFSSPLETPRKRFRVLTPSGVIADGFWERREDIPARIPDRGNHYFDTDDAEIIEEIVPAESSPKPAESPDMVWVNRAEYNSLRECMIEAADEIQRLRAPSSEPPRQTTDIAPKCDCYAMFGQPHFHDCPAAIAKKEASMHEAIKHVPPQYLKERLSFDYSEKRNLYEITGGGYVLAETEDSEIADAICKMFNKARGASPDCPEYAALRERAELRVLAKMATDHPCFTNSLIAVTDAYRRGWEDCTAPSSHSEPELVKLRQIRLLARWDGPDAAPKRMHEIWEKLGTIIENLEMRAALASTPQNEPEK